MSSAGKHIAILLPDMRVGGVERVRAVLAAEFLRRDLNVDFVLVHRRGELLGVIPPNALTVELGGARLSSALLPLIRYLRHSRPQVLLAAMWPLTSLAVVANRLSGCPARVVISDHNTLSAAYSGWGRSHRAMLRASLAATYPFADARIVVSRGVGADLARLARMREDRFTVIHNPLVFAPPVEAEEVDTSFARWPVASGARILSVGRLKAQKNHALLIDAFARLLRKREAVLMILGEGEERRALEDQVRRLGIADRVSLPGFIRAPAATYKSANLFVLSSDYEGFGNVLVEALSAGLPIVSTDCPSGPRDILNDGEFGRLVPCGDADALADAMDLALASPPNPAEQRRRAQDFSVHDVASAYLALMFPDPPPGR